MQAVHSAGLLVFRRRPEGPEVFLVHPGGPLWAGKDEHAWSMPKGVFAPDEEPLAAAIREFTEETGIHIDGCFVALGTRRQPSGKLVHAFAVKADVNAHAVRSNTFEMEWPRRSGRMQSFPEIDRAAWFSLADARSKLHKGQVPFIDDLERLLAEG